ncbi:MAG TPA: SRPBCC family protein [Kofleriaceae bacterium]|nr:SRPBCC family protein [Kofleriaceae bacterium]
MSVTRRETLLTTPTDREIRFERTFDASCERVWRALTEPELLAQWWGRGNKLVIERMDVERGGHWRFVEHAPDGVHGFEGRYREVSPPHRFVRTFEWDGMPGYVLVETVTLEDVGNGRTRLVSVSLFHTVEERDGMLNAEAAKGLDQSYAALDRLLARLASSDREGGQQ